jgi:hypothetical protein
MEKMEKKVKADELQHLRKNVVSLPFILITSRDPVSGHG